MPHQRGNPYFCRSRPPNAVLGSLATPPLREPSSALPPFQAEPTHFAPPHNPATNLANPRRFGGSSLAGPQGIDTGSMEEISRRRRRPNRDFHYGLPWSQCIIPINLRRHGWPGQPCPANHRSYTSLRWRIRVTSTSNLASSMVYTTR